MRTFVRVTAIALTTLFILFGAIMCTFAGYAFIFVFPGFLAVVLTFTLITQIILFTLVRSAQSLFYDFFYCSAFTASILLTWCYGACIWIIDSMDEHRGGNYYGRDEGILTLENAHLFFGIHLLLLVPVVLQVVLAVWKGKKSAGVVNNLSV